MMAEKQKFTYVTDLYRDTYLQGWDSRMSDIFVNPFIYDFDSIKYQAWNDGWNDADLAIKEDNGNTIQ